VRTGGAYFVLAILAIPFVAPIVWMFGTSIKPENEAFTGSLFPKDGSPRWENYASVFSAQPFGQQFWNSLYIAVAVTAGVLVITSLSGYSFARLRFPGRNLLFVVLLGGLMVPTESILLPLYRTMGSVGLVDTHVPLIVLPILGAYCVFGTFIMRQFFLGIPADLEEAGRLDGLGRAGVFLHIALPLAPAPLGALGILAFLHSWNSFLEPLVFISSRNRFTLPLALTQFNDSYGLPIWTTQMAATALTVIPVVIVYLFAQRSFVRGFASTGLKG